MILKGELESNRYIGMLSKLLRFTLDMSNRERITLAEEIDYLTSYIELQRMRLDRNMDYAFRFQQQCKDHYASSIADGGCSRK